MGQHRDADARRQNGGFPPSADAAEPPEAIVLTGYVSSDSRAAYTRLYLDAALRSYVEVLDGDIRHREHAGGDSSPAGPRTRLWIWRGALLEYTRVGS